MVKPLKGETTMSYQVAKLIARVAENLPDMSEAVMQGWIENPKGLQEFLTGLCPPASEFRVWKTIKLGTNGLKTADDFRKSFKDNGFKVSDWANDILGKPAFTVATEETELYLVVVSVAELGFKNGATCKNIYARAKERGLDICPNEVGPQLRLQYKDQPKGEWLVVAMEPLRDSAGNLELFGVRRGDNGLWLDSPSGASGAVWRADRRWVFALPRKYQKESLGTWSLGS
jgi:hypothetical protein